MQVRIILKDKTLTSVMKFLGIVNTFREFDYHILNLVGGTSTHAAIQLQLLIQNNNAAT